MSLQKLKELQLDRILDMEEAVALSAYARSLENEYGFLELTMPEWLVKSSDVLREEIARRTRAADLATLKALEGELEGYKTIGEKRTEAQRRLGDLQKKLGLSPAKSGR
jgi:hypothetical protein